MKRSFFLLALLCLSWFSLALLPPAGEPTNFDWKHFGHVSDRMYTIMNPLASLGGPLFGGNACLSSGTADWTSTANWGSCGGGVPGDGDTSQIAYNSSMTVSTTVATGASTGTAPGIEILLSGTAGGTLTVASGGSLTAKGVNITTYPAILVDRYATLKVNAGGTLSINATSDYQTAIVKNGHFACAGTSSTNPNAYLTIPAANIFWNTLSTAKVHANTQAQWWDHSKSILIQKLYNVLVPDSGPISNSTNNGLGSYGNTSLVISGATPTWTNEVSTYAGIANNGDYWVDYAKGLVFYKAASYLLHVTYQFYFGTWYSTGIIDTTNNASGDSLTVDNCTIDHWGSNNTVDTEFTGGAFVVRYKQPVAVSADSGFSFTGNVCNYCSHILTLYNSTGMDASHLMQVTGNTFTAARFAGTAFGGSEGILNPGYTGYVNFSHNTFDSWTLTFGNDWRRAASPGMQFNYNTGNIMGELLPKTSAQAAAASTASHNTLVQYGTTGVNAAQMVWGGSVGQQNVYSDNTLTGSNADMQSHTVFTRNNLTQCPWECIGVDTGNYWTPYLNDVTITNNLVTNSVHDTTVATDEAGGIYLGTRWNTWSDGVVVANNTFDGGTVGIVLSRMEGQTPAAVTFISKLKLINNIVSNSYSGIYRPSDAATYITKLAPARLDYNVDYGQLNGATNVSPATFIMGGVEYNTSGSKTAGGVYLFTPSYTLPCATSRTLALAASGTIPLATLAETISWGGGATQNVVVNKGTTSASGQTTTQLTDSGQSWTAHAYQGYQVIIYDATHSYQYALITDNAATTLTLLANKDGGALAFAPIGGTSVYAIVNSELTLTDSSDGACGAGARTVHAGIYSPELVLTSQSDAGITLASYAQTGNPNYLSATNWDIPVTSSGYNTGTSADAPSVDIIGTARPQETLFDIGAYEFIDTTPPTATITAPTANPTYATGTAAMNLGGTASDDVGVTSVTWTCDKCSVTSGTASGTTSWSASLTLGSGANAIVVTAHDAAGNTGTDSLTATYTPASTGKGSLLLIRAPDKKVSK